MKARDIMQSNVLTADNWAAASKVAAHMVAGRISGFPITNTDNAVIGIVTELDLIKALRAGKDLSTTLVDELMTLDVISVDAETSVEQVMEILEMQRIIRVPVVSGGELVGIVSRSDVLRAALGSSLDVAI